MNQESRSGVTRRGALGGVAGLTAAALLGDRWSTATATTPDPGTIEATGPVAFSRDGRRLAVGRAAGVGIWELSVDGRPRQPGRTVTGPGTGGSFGLSADGTRLVTTGGRWPRPAAA